MGSTEVGARRRGPRAFWASLDRGQRRSLLLMLAVVGGLHAVGFATLVAFSGPHRTGIGPAGGLTLGIGVTAYTLGLRHAFDADHISAIDSTTRKRMAEGKRPLSVGFWFSLGHSSVVFVLAFLLAVGVRSLASPVRGGSPGLHHAANWIGTLVSGSFLYAIAGVNIVVLAGIVGVFRNLKRGV